MKCHNCGHQNTENAKFCSQCGTSLSYPCPSCGTIAGPDDRFCRNCGTALTDEPETSEPTSDRPADDLSRYLPEELLAKMRSARDGHAMEGERRTVTMLFADVQGSTSSAEQLDPEDWAEIMNGAFEWLIAPIYRFEGTLAQLRGDAVLAFFGAPIAHEDDPVRALRAGLEIVDAMARYSAETEERWGVPAHVRVGINTGLVVVGAMGSDLRVEYTALGDAINVAARMEQTAEPDTVRVTGHTLSLTDGLFEAEELGPIEVKGKSSPVTAHRVVSYIGSGSITETAPLVGRSAEMTQLEEVPGRVLEGTGRIVSVIADAGVGKTRLLDEFRARTQTTFESARHFDDQGRVNWLHGSSRSYDSDRPYSTIADMLSGWWSHDGVEPDFDRVEAAVTAAGLDDPDMAAHLGFIAGVPLPERVEGFIQSLEPQVLNAKANQAAIAYLKAVADKRPTLIVFEDLHWSDDLSLALVENLMALTESMPLGMVMAMRPYRDEPTWRIHEVAARDHHHRYISLTLDPLTPNESSDLLDSLLDDPGVDAKTKDEILQRSQGNPLYIEQMVRALRDLDPGEFDTSQIPASLRGLLTARLDRLGEEQRYLVQIASVLGSEFDPDMLAALVETSGASAVITDLLRVGIFVERADAPDPLGFRHALIQEAAYETILRRTRRQLHRRVADYLIAHDGGPGEIARHLVSADETENAYPYLIAAGAAAARSMALADAIELLQTAIENTPDDADPEMIVRAHDALGDAYALIPDLPQASAAYQRLYEYGENTQRPEAQVSALNRLAYATASIGADLDRANEYLADARRIAEENEDELGLAEYHMNACLVASLDGDPGKAAAHDEETVRLGEQSGVGAVRMLGMVRRAVNYTHLLDWERSIPAVESALAEAAEFDQEEGLATVRLAGSATEKLVRGNVREALEEANEVIGTLDRYGSFYLGMAHRTLAECHYQLGNVEESLSHYLDVTRLAAEIQPFTAAAGYSGMALVYATAGLTDQIPNLESEAEERVGGPIGEFLASTVLADLGWSALMVGHPERAAENFTRGFGVSSVTQFIERPRLLIGRARTHLEMNDLDSARADLDEALAFTEEKGLGLYLAHLGLVEGLLAAKDGAIDEAERALIRAQEEALTRGQRIRLVEIMGARARIARLSGDASAEESHLASAYSATQAIAEGIADESLRTSFSTRWEHAITAADV